MGFRINKYTRFLTLCPPGNGGNGRLRAPRPPENGGNTRLRVLLLPENGGNARLRALRPSENGGNARLRALRPSENGGNARLRALRPPENGENARLRRFAAGRGRGNGRRQPPGLSAGAGLAGGGRPPSVWLDIMFIVRNLTRCKDNEIRANYKIKCDFFVPRPPYFRAGDPSDGNRGWAEALSAPRRRGPGPDGAYYI